MKRFACNSFEPCEVCGSLKTQLYETEDGARYVACSPEHAEEAIISEQVTAAREIAKAFRTIKKMAAPQRAKKKATPRKIKRTEVTLSV